MRRAAATSAMVLALAACAPNHGAAYPRAFADAERAESAGRFAEAARKYDEAATLARLPRDRDHARYLAAIAMLHAGDTKDGVARLDAIAAGDANAEHTAEAAYRAAAARLDAGDDGAWTALEDIVRKFPKSGVAHVALRRVVAHKDETAGREASVAYLRALASGPLGSSEIGELVAFEIAEHLAALGKDGEARDAFLAVASRWPYPFGALWDDALFRASEMDEKLGRYQDAVADLERMLKERETTTLMGSYQRPRMSPALFRIGVLYAAKIGDHAKARDAFHRLYTEFTTSPLRAAAIWREARLFAADGNAGAACDRLSTLVKDDPDSRYVPCATDACASIKRPEKSKAPTYCHPYLLRDDADDEARKSD